MGGPNQGKNVKRLSISPSDDGDTLFVRVEETRDGKSRRLPAVPISKDEAVGLTTLLETAIPKILGWL